MVKLADATITSQGQVSIPKKVRDRMGLKKGSKVVFWQDDEGNLILRESETPVEFTPQEWQKFLEKTQKEPVTRVSTRKDALAHLDRLAKRQ